VSAGETLRSTSSCSSCWRAEIIGEAILGYEARCRRTAGPTVLGNHDQPRIASRVGGQARVAAMLLLTARDADLYYGDRSAWPTSDPPGSSRTRPGSTAQPGPRPERTPMRWTVSERRVHHRHAVAADRRRRGAGESAPAAAPTSICSCTAGCSPAPCRAGPGGGRLGSRRGGGPLLAYVRADGASWSAGRAAPTAGLPDAGADGSCCRPRSTGRRAGRGRVRSGPTRARRRARLRPVRRRRRPAPRASHRRVNWRARRPVPSRAIPPVTAPGT
jgi:hypothetical protein